MHYWKRNGWNTKARRKWGRWNNGLPPSSLVGLSRDFIKYFLRENLQSLLSVHLYKPLIWVFYMLPYLLPRNPKCFSVVTLSFLNFSVLYLSLFDGDWEYLADFCSPRDIYPNYFPEFVYRHRILETGNLIKIYV